MQLIIEWEHRNCLHVCLSTKAVRFEVVSDMTTEAFLAALRRFIGRRGLCSVISSDNGTNFKGANNELKELYELLKSGKLQQNIANYYRDCSR